MKAGTLYCKGKGMTLFSGKKNILKSRKIQKYKKFLNDLRIQEVNPSSLKLH